MAYHEMVQVLNEYLDDYLINEQVVGKRIFAPNILVIKNGNIKGIETGISSLLTNPNDELTDEIKKDSYEKINNLLSKYTNNVCMEHGC